MFDSMLLINLQSPLSDSGRGFSFCISYDYFSVPLVVLHWTGFQLAWIRLYLWSALRLHKLNCNNDVFHYRSINRRTNRLKHSFYPPAITCKIIIMMCHMESECDRKYACPYMYVYCFYIFMQTQWMMHLLESTFNFVVLVTMTIKTYSILFDTIAGKTTAM